MATVQQLKQELHLTMRDGVLAPCVSFGLSRTSKRLFRASLASLPSRFMAHAMALLLHIVNQINLRSLSCCEKLNITPRSHGAVLVVGDPSSFRANLF